MSRRSNNDSHYSKSTTREGSPRHYRDRNPSRSRSRSLSSSSSDDDRRPRRETTSTTTTTSSSNVPAATSKFSSMLQKSMRGKFRPTGIQMKLEKPVARSDKPKIAVASIFNEDSDDEPEEMPKEARMRMRNIGRDTPTSSGPNSFGKTKQGFSDAKKVFEKSLKEAMDNAEKD